MKSNSFWPADLIEEARAKIVDEIRAIYKKISSSSEFGNKIRAWLPDERTERIDISITQITS